MTGRSQIDWVELRSTAVEMAQNAYAPYSGLKVGAAALTDRGDILGGCNVENASYGLTLCSECGIVSDLHRRGGGRLVALYVLASTGEILAPCGRCRQLLLEAGGPSLLVYARPEPVSIAELLPYPFGDSDLPHRSEP